MVILLCALAILGALVEFKVNIGISIFSSAVLILVLKRFTFTAFLRAMYFTIIDKQAIRIILIVIIITYFADLLKISTFLDDIVNSFSKYLSPKVFVPLFAFIIGALPMPGGALVSAPLVERGSSDIELGSAEKTVVNFWFRHIWEPTSPLYPEIILASSILGVSIIRIIAVQWPFTLLMFLSGVFFLLPLIRSSDKKELDKSPKVLYEMTLSLMPILIVILLILVFHFSIILSGIIGILYIVLVKKVKFKSLLKAFNYKLLIKLSFLMFAIFFLKYIVKSTGVINGVYLFMKSKNVPSFVILFSLPFVVSLMSGAASATIGVSYPLLLPLLKTPNFNPYALFIAFLGGWTALMFTPTHLCLSLTVEYFNAKFDKVYPLLLKNIGFMFAFSLLFYLLFRFV